MEYMNLTFKFPLIEEEILEDLRFTSEEEDAMVYRNSTFTADFSRVLTKTYELYFTRDILEGEEVITELQLYITKEDNVLKPIKLMKLPLIVMEQVIRSMAVMETVYTESVEDDASAYFYTRNIKNQNEEENKQIELKIGNHENDASYVWNYRCLTTYWQDIHFGATELYLDLMDLFSFSVEHVKIFEKWRVYMDYETAIDWVHKNIGPKIGRSEYLGQTVEDSTFSKILNGLKSNECDLYLKPSENYRKIHFKFTKDTPHWKIHEGHWLTLGNFSNLKCVTLIIDRCALSDGELHILLFNLTHGSFASLELLSITVYRNIEMEVLLEGIVHEEFQAERVFDRYGHDYNLSGGIEFQTTDGYSCTLSINAGAVPEEGGHDNNQTELVFIVWKPMET